MQNQAAEKEILAGWNIFAVQISRMEDVNNTNQKFLRIFWDLSSDSGKTQTKAVATLIRSLAYCQERHEKETKDKSFCSEVEYSLNRLISGTGSSTQSSRLGFSLALAEVIPAILRFYHFSLTLFSLFLPVFVSFYSSSVGRRG